jgi:hypothetical protein
MAAKSDIQKIEKELLVLRWMVGLVIVVEVAPLLTRFFG